MTIYLEANTLKQLAKKVNESGGTPVGRPAAKIFKHGVLYTTVIWWVQAVTK